MRFILAVLCIVTTIALVSCGPRGVIIQERNMAQRNPTVYEFDAPMSAVRHSLNEVRGAQWSSQQPPFHGAFLAWKEDADPFAEKILEKPGNEHDAYLYGTTEEVGKSELYLQDGRSLSYCANFHIHLVPVSDSRTRVEVFTHNSRVVVGERWYLAHGNALMYVDVSPSSIEEYQILLDIGAKLSVKDMPKLALPATNAPVKQLKKLPYR